MAFYFNDTIAAISTPIGKAGIGIVRLSGQQAIPIVGRVFLSKDGRKAAEFKSHTVHYGWVMECRTPNGKGRVIDEVLLTVMRAPRTYTREDIVEINCHSGIVVLKKILDLVVQNGARIAEPGEFTRRAFLNGRIDLAQAEAVLDIINAKTESSLKAARNQLTGRLSERLGDLRSQLIDILANIEASLDFSEEDIEVLGKDIILQGLRLIQERLQRLISESKKGMILRTGVTIVISGKPNVGKSSFMNLLLKQQRVIVTPLPGTTRDSVEATVDIKGMPVTLVDTAGITHADTLVDRLSVQKSLDYLSKAELVLFLLDGSQEISDEDLYIAERLKEKYFIVVINKIDLPQKIRLDDEALLGFLADRQTLRISATENIGIDSLEEAVSKSFFSGQSLEPEDVLVTNARHRQALEKAFLAISQAIEAMDKGLQEELICLDTKEAIDYIGEVSGERINDEVLDRIFSQFCIGK